MDFFLNFLMAFISLGSVASDLSFIRLINHILIPELSQSERLTDTQLQGTYHYIDITLTNQNISLRGFRCLGEDQP